MTSGHSTVRRPEATYLKILIISPGLHLGGSERFTSWLSSELARRGHTVTLGVRSDPARDHYQVDPAVTVVRLYDRYTASSPSASLPGPDGSHQAGRWARVNRRLRRASVFDRSLRELVGWRTPDVVLTVGGPLSMATIVALRGTKTPVVATERGGPFSSDIPPLMRHLRRLSYQHAAGVVVLLDAIAERMSAEWGLTGVEVIPNARTFTVAGLDSIEQRAPVVLSVGRLHPIKGLPTLLRAWERSSARQRGWRLRIVGDGPERGELERLVAELQINDSVAMPGAVNDVEAEYRAARVFVLPSRGEGFPNALLEAMTFGCACIASDCPGGPAEMLNHGESGVLVPVDGVAELSAVLDRVSSDPALASSLGAAARLRAGDFDPEMLLDRWESALQRAAASRPGRDTHRDRR